MYKPSINFVDRSNNRAHKETKRICAKHLFSYWGNDQWGNPYKNCVQGNRLNQECRELKEADKNG